VAPRRMFCLSALRGGAMLSLRSVWRGAFGLLLVFLSSSAASAHSPYARPVASFVTADGRALSIELYYGDGIFFADPVRGQVKDSRGAVVAYTPVGVNAAASCRSLDDCLIYLSNGIGVVESAWRLDIAQADWGADISDDFYVNFAEHARPLGFVEQDDALSMRALLAFMSHDARPLLILASLWLFGRYAHLGLRTLGRRYGGVWRVAIWLGGAVRGVSLLLAVLFGYGLVVAGGFPMTLFLGLVIAAVALRSVVERRVVRSLSSG
jgi:hypothetical protein